MMKILWRRWRERSGAKAGKNEPGKSGAKQSAATAPIRGAHYFGAHDPITFWENFDPQALPQELAALKDMGFDTLFLLIPWHAFFPDAVADRLDPWYEARLHHFLREAERQMLAVHARLFYAHSAVDTREIVEHTRQYGLLTQSATTVPALAAQAKALAGSVAAFPAWRQAFITWEDFWPVFEGPPHWSLADRQRLGTVSGFSDWIETQGDEAWRTARGLVRHEDAWTIPQHRTPGMALWIRFFDHLLRTRVLAPCRQAFPDLGIEVRIDAYPIPSGNGTTQTWHYFDAFQDCRGPRYLYWGPFYGMANEGERLTAAAALRGLDNLLVRFAGDGGTPPIVDQLNFTDETLQFAAHHARIEDSEIPRFLEDGAPLLRCHARGYALWAVRDYRENWLRNAGFQRGLDGWQGHESPGIRQPPGSVRLAAGETLSQVFSPARRAQAGPEAYPHFFCDLVADRETASLTESLQVRLDAHPPRGFTRAGDDLLQARFAPHEVNWDETSLHISAPSALSAPVTIKAVYFYGFVQRLHVADEMGEPARYAPAVRQLNALLAGSQGKSER